MHKDFFRENGLFNLSGRLGRFSFLLFTLIAQTACVVVYFVLNSIFSLLELLISSSTNQAEKIPGVFLVAGVLPVTLFILVTASIRRCHDIGLNGRWTLLLFLPFINVFFAIFLFAKKGSQEENKFGPPLPKLIRM